MNPAMNVGPTIAQQREFYDERWIHKQYANQLQRERTIEILRGLRFVRTNPPRILELGCGTGWLTGILGRFGPAVGLELSPAAVEKATATLPDVEFHAFDISANASLGTFDVVISHEVIEHLEDQAMHVALAARYLNPGGILILTTPNGHPWLKHLRPQPGHEGAQPIENWLTKAQLVRLVSRELAVLECRTILPARRGTGVLRAINSGVAAAALRRAGLGTLHQHVLKRLGFGLHLYVVAQKRSEVEPCVGSLGA